MSKPKSKKVIPVNKEVLIKIHSYTQRIDELMTQRNNLLEGYALGMGIPLYDYIFNITKGQFEMKEDK